MSLVNPTDFPIVPSSTSGTQLADILNRLFNAYETNQANATRPPELKSGGLWSKVDGNTLRLMMYDGAVDIEIGNITGGVGSFGNSGGTAMSEPFNPAKTYQAGDLIMDPVTKVYSVAKTDLVAKPFNAGDWTALTDPLKGMKDAILAVVDTKITNALKGYLPLTGGALTGNLTTTGTIDAVGAISSKADITAFKP